MTSSTIGMCGFLLLLFFVAEFLRLGFIGFSSDFETTCTMKVTTNAIMWFYDFISPLVPQKQSPL